MRAKNGPESPEARKETVNGFSLRSFSRDQSCQQLGSGFPASRTVGEYIPVVLSHRVYGPCYSSPRKPIRWPTTQVAGSILQSPPWSNSPSNQEETLILETSGKTRDKKCELPLRILKVAWFCGKTGVAAARGWPEATVRSWGKAF